MDKARLHAVVHGHVQGVGFRYFVLEHAYTLDLTGWVRNTFRGDVEVCAEGERSSLEQLLDYLRQGPSRSFVNQVDQEWETANDEFDHFSVAASD